MEENAFGDLSWRRELIGFGTTVRNEERERTSVTQETYHRLFFPQNPEANLDPVPEVRFDLERQPLQSIKSEKQEKAAAVGFFDSGDSCPWPRMPMCEQDEPGQLVPSPPSPKRSRRRLTKKERERERARRKKHHTKAWFERQLLAVASGELVMTQQQYRALLAFGRVRGWHRGPPAKR